MAAALSSASLPTPAARGLVNVSQKAEAPKWRTAKVGYGAGSCMSAVLVRALASSPTPPGISEHVLSESIEKEACAGPDPASGECVASWDEAEELSAAASHARDMAESSDPLEEYCKDDPETDECSSEFF